MQFDKSGQRNDGLMQVNSKVDPVVPAGAGTGKANPQSFNTQRQNCCQFINATLKIPTAAELIHAIRAVSFSITHKFFGNAAAPISTAELTALGRPSAVHFIRLIPTLRPPVTHLSFRDAHLSMSALKFTCDGQIKRVRAQVLKPRP